MKNRNNALIDTKIILVHITPYTAGGIVAFKGGVENLDSNSTVHSVQTRS